MYSLDFNYLASVGAGTVELPSTEECLQFMDSAVHVLPKLAYYSFAVGSAMSGGPFSAPAKLTILYHVMYYNEHRVLIGVAE